MIKKNLILFALTINVSMCFAQKLPRITIEIAEKLSALPLHCIATEFPNKTSHLSNAATDAKLLPSELHPAFFGCLDWHSSVHGHWMLIRLLKTIPNIKNKAEIIATLNNTFTQQKMIDEAAYFTKYIVANTFERTYGWAWLLKLDQELGDWKNEDAEKWHLAMQPLTTQILKLWKLYLPKQTYPNRTGVHSNTAFGLGFALDWARWNKDSSFEKLIVEKTKYFYLNNKKTPAYLEPDGSDFFSPSLEIADLMRRVLSQQKFSEWLNNFYEPEGIKRILEPVTVSDLSDYQTVHLVGLSFSRAWCMKAIAKRLSKNNKLKKMFDDGAAKFLTAALPLIFEGNYGGDHWLASFAVYALSI